MSMKRKSVIDVLRQMKRLSYLKYINYDLWKNIESVGYMYIERMEQCKEYKAAYKEGYDNIMHSITQDVGGAALVARAVTSGYGKADHTKIDFSVYAK